MSKSVFGTEVECCIAVRSRVHHGMGNFIRKQGEKRIIRHDMYLNEYFLVLMEELYLLEPDRNVQSRLRAVRTHPSKYLNASCPPELRLEVL